MDKIFECCEIDDPETLGLLIEEFGSEILESVDDFGLAPVHVAVESRASHVIAYLAEVEPGSLGSSTKDGMTPAHYAAALNDVNTLILIERRLGKDYLVKKNVNGETPITLAARKAQLEAVQYLLPRVDLLESEKHVLVEAVMSSFYESTLDPGLDLPLKLLTYLLEEIPSSVLLERPARDMFDLREFTAVEMEKLERKLSMWKRVQETFDRDSR